MNTYFVRRIRKAILSGQDPMVFVPCREDGQALTSSVNEFLLDDQHPDTQILTESGFCFQFRPTNSFCQKWVWAIVSPYDPRSLEETVERLVKRLDESPNACDCLLIAVPDETVPDETVPDEWDDYLESQYEDRTAFE